ncbi:MAG TPA: IgA Peptidase M64 [Thermoanaerobaculia bacterium]|nr:IgA Peptidase M64 [Thermoanaerobaculia bacterium]
MKHAFRALLLVVCAPALAAAAPRTMRFDYFHSGNAKEERFSWGRAVVEPLEWPGNPARPLDDLNLGKYFFEVRDAATGRPIYSRGFASIYGEWESTPEAQKIDRTFEESVRFPAPDAPVTIVIEKRDRANAFREIWRATIDPKSMFVDRAVPPAPAPLLALQKSGDPASKVDFLILGDGYTREEEPKFEKDARRLVDILFSTSPFKEHRADFNVWGLCPPSPESGISRPSTGIHRRNPVGSTYDAFGSERYVLTFDNRAFREIAQFAPYEFVEILVNGKTYGGGGIFNLYSTVAADSLWAPYVFVHEFGHHFSGLADEYYTSDVAYQTGGERVEPWEPNATAMKNPADLKWKDLVSPGTPLPTPWDKEAFESRMREVQAKRRAIRAANRAEEEMDALFLQERKDDTRQLGTDRYSGKVGAFEGANYEAKGYYRPQEDCIMFTRDEVGFCAVCRRALERVIGLYAAR